MEVIKLVLGELASNCYAAVVGENRCVLIDVGDGAPVVQRRLAQQGLIPVAILLTHGHYDHIAGVEQLRRAYDLTVYIHAADGKMLEDSAANLGDWLAPGQFQPVAAYETVTEGEKLVFGETAFTVLHTPGHTKGSVCWQCDDCLFTGDTLFRLSRGRTDFPGGSDREMLDSFRRLKQIPTDYRVLPGHNESSTLAFEQGHNPTMRGL